MTRATIKIIMSIQIDILFEKHDRHNRVLFTLVDIVATVCSGRTLFERLFRYVLILIIN